MGAVGFTSGDPRKLNRTGYTKGDVVAANAAGELTGVAVGADTEVLTADSTEPVGVDWEPGGGGGGGGTPSNTVVSETSFGQASSAGASTNYSRGDHTHGTPAAPSVPSAAGTVTAETSFGQASSAGVAATFSRGDHTHGTPAAPSVPSPAASVVAETSFGQVSAVGTGVAYARDDHTHGTPAAPSVPSASGTVASETSYGQVSSAGVATAYSRGDHTHGTPALGTTGTTAAAGNHGHTAADVGAVPTSRAVNTTSPLTGGGDLSADRTLAVSVGTTAGTVAAGDDSRITGAQQRSTLTTKGDLYVATASATTTRQPVGTNGQVLTADSAESTGMRWAAPAGGSTLVVRRQRYTAGDITLNLGGGAFNLITGPSLAIPAAEGDYIELSLSIMVQSGNAYLDPVVVVGGAAVRYASTDTNASAGEGWPPLYTSPSTFRTAAGLWGFEAAAGDISGGNVTFQMAMRGTTGTLYGSSTYPFYWIAKNYGAVDFA